MKNFIMVAGAVILMPVVMGMGASPPGEIPKPRKDFRAVIVDSDGIRSEVSQISFHGEIYVDGERGKALVAIPFDRIARLEASEEDESSEESKDHPAGPVRVAVHLTDGSTTDILLRRSAKWSGKARFGNLVIKTGDLESIEFLR